MKLNKLLLCLSLVTFSSLSLADNIVTTQPMDMSKMMYFDFGLGVGGASGWNSGANTAINAMTMGGYFNKNLGIEIGMDVLPDGSNSAGQAMIMTYHLAAKGVLPLSEVFSLYGKAGIGINQYEGETPANGMAMTNQASFGLYYAGGVQFNFNKNFAIYLEGSGVGVPNIGNNGNANAGAFGSTYMGTLGMEVRI